MNKQKFLKRAGFIGIEVAIISSIVLVTGFAALNTFNARATNAKDGLIGQFQNSQLNLNGSGGQLTDDQINQLKASVLESIYPINSIYTTTSSTINPSSILNFGVWEHVSGTSYPVGWRRIN